ncbi:MAG: hypothetical protein J5822_05600 [Eubacteriaceae bacterium]|nr:hypothetical protein [Eubacteriaceae bacterium]
MDNPAEPVMTVPDGRIDFNHVYFSYKQGGDYALEDIDLHIKAGETVGIIGGTGSGKSHTRRDRGSHRHRIHAR